MSKSLLATPILSLLVILLPAPARAAGVITALTASANPAPVNTDVTFTVKGTSGGCPEVILDYGDGQTFTMLNVSFNNNTNTTSPPHKYAAAKSYLVKADPGRGCTGSATASLNVMGAGAGGPVGGVAGSMSRMARQAEANLLRAMAPHIDSVFPFSVIRPGGAVIVQGVNFGPEPGRFLLRLQGGQEFQMGGLTWAGNSVSGNIEPTISGVPDQPATVQVVRADGAGSNAAPVQFTAARDLQLVTGHPEVIECIAGQEADEKNTATTKYSGNSCVFDHDAGDWWDDSEAGMDRVRLHLRNGWVLDHAEINSTLGKTDPPVVIKDGSEAELTIRWDTAQSPSGRSSFYSVSVFVTGPAGTTYY